jgi:aspartate/methionine/tyrosine aminotransferase
MPHIHLRHSIDGVPESATLAINEKSVELIAQGRDIIRSGLGQSPFPVPPTVVETLRESGLQVHDPAGGFYLLLDLRPLAEPLAARGITTGAQVAEGLLKETGVALLPGTDFNRPAGELSLRMAYVAFDGSAALAACESLPDEAPLDAAFLERICSPTLEGVQRIRDWLTGP